MSPPVELPACDPPPPTVDADWRAGCANRRRARCADGRRACTAACFGERVRCRARVRPTAPSHESAMQCRKLQLLSHQSAFRGSRIDEAIRIGERALLFNHQYALSRFMQIYFGAPVIRDLAACPICSAIFRATTLRRVIIGLDATQSSTDTQCAFGGPFVPPRPSRQSFRKTRAPSPRIRSWPRRRTGAIRRRPARHNGRSAGSKRVG